MQKLSLSVIAAVIVGIAMAYAMITAASFVPKSASENPVHISVGKTTLNYEDNLTWNATGLPSNAEYAITLRWPGTALVIGKGNTNTDGEADGSILIAKNIPAGTVILTIELVSDSTLSASATLNILP